MALALVEIRKPITTSGFLEAVFGKFGSGVSIDGLAGRGGIGEGFFWLWQKGQVVV